MKRQLRTHVAALCLLAPAAITFTALPATALAQPATPQVLSLAVSTDHGLAPGSRLGFVVNGTPYARAFVRVPGVRGMIPLRETQRGVYTGDYVVAPGDAIDPHEQIHAILRLENRTVTADYLFPPELSHVAVAGEPLRIEHFQASRTGRAQPGSAINFVVDAAPGGVAFVRLPGVPGKLHLHELRPGHYVGSYTTGAADRIDLNGPVVATVRAGDRVATANLDRPIAVAEPAHAPPSVADVSPREGEVVHGPQAVVAGRFDDAGGNGIDPATVRVRISGRDVTREARIDPGSFTFRGPLAPGRHTVDVVARDTAGNAVHRTWSFDVATAAGAVPIAILNQTENAQVDGRMTQVQGRTAPYANVDVRVDAVPPVAPGTYGVAHELLSRTVQADAAGNFGFTFTSPVAVPGTRYDIRMLAHKADVTNEAWLTLYQRLG